MSWQQGFTLPVLAGQLITLSKTVRYLVEEESFDLLKGSQLEASLHVRQSDGFGPAAGGSVPLLQLLQSRTADLALLDSTGQAQVSLSLECSPQIPWASVPLNPAEVRSLSPLDTCSCLTPAFSMMCHDVYASCQMAERPVRPFSLKLSPADDCVHAGFHSSSATKSSRAAKQPAKRPEAERWPLLTAKASVSVLICLARLPRRRGV